MELSAYLEAGNRSRSGYRSLRQGRLRRRRLKISNAWSQTGSSCRDPEPCYYVYRLTWRGHTQTGLAAVASLADYATNRIRKHELTTPVKEDDRVRQIEAINAQTGPVMSGYPNAPEIDAMLAQAAAGKSDVDVTADDGVRHQLWRIADGTTIDKLTRAFEALPAIYIADGHHRSAAAARVAAGRHGEGSHGYFLSVIFPEREMTILDYNRVVKDLNGHSTEQFLTKLRENFAIDSSEEPVRPRSSHEFGMYLAGRWHRLTIRPELVPQDPIGRLPITILARNVIEPLLGVTDPRSDKRIDFVGGGARSVRARTPGDIWRNGCRVSLSTRRRWATSWRWQTRAESCRRNPPGSSQSSPTAWSITCSISKTAGAGGTGCTAIFDDSPIAD